MKVKKQPRRAPKKSHTSLRIPENNFYISEIYQQHDTITEQSRSLTKAKLSLLCHRDFVAYYNIKFIFSPVQPRSGVEKEPQLLSGSLIFTMMF